MTETAGHSRPTTLLRVHAWLIVTAVVVTIGSASAVALTRPSDYVATAQVSVAPERAEERHSDRRWPPNARSPCPER